MKLTKVNNRFINKIKRYLDEVKVSYMELGETRNLVMLRANSRYHYLLVHFDDMKNNEMNKFRYFDVKIVYPMNPDHVIESIKRYINEDYPGEACC